MSALLEENRAANLEKANEVRRDRAKLKRLIAEGRIRLSEVLLVDKQHLYTMRLKDLLLVVPHLGPVKVTYAMRRLRISEHITLENLSMHRREELLDWIAREHPAVRL